MAIHANLFQAVCRVCARTQHRCNVCFYVFMSEKKSQFLPRSLLICDCQSHPTADMNMRTAVREILGKKKKQPHRVGTQPTNQHVHTVLTQ